MKAKSSTLEVLSPVGNRESFFAAINNGADAVYLGIRDFNARNNIQNFSVDELEEIVDYAHMFDVKVYLTFNILINNEEIQDALNVIKKAYMLGVDAFIVQDIGIAMLMKKFFPEIVLHASTQMGIHNLEGAKFVEKLGFKRVVLSRETPLEEIKRIHEGTHLEIEYFVQGALCVAFSGNCYLCSLLTGNSGNRGKCQQFCRLPYKLKSKNVEKEGYFLSAKDFCMLENLKELADAGVQSFKIEGRARRIGYIAGVTNIYKKAVENDFKIDLNDIENLKKLFNRGDYTKGYFEDKKILYSKIQGHKGVKIGKVENFFVGKKFNVIEVSSNHQIKKGDGLKFIKNEREVASIGVCDVKQKGRNFVITTTAKIEKGADVHLTIDSEMEKQFLDNSRKLEIFGKFVAKKNERAKLSFCFKNVSVTAISENAFDEAKKQPLKKEDVFTQVSKFSDEPFSIKELEIEMDDVFAPKSVLNDLRRRAVQKLKTEIFKSNKKQRICLDFKLRKNANFCKNVNKKMYVIKDLNNLEKVSKNSSDLIVYSPENYEIKNIKSFENFVKNSNMQGFLDLPIFATEKDLIFIKNILKNTDLGVIANNYYAFDLVESEKIIIGMGLNVFNSFSCEFYEKMGIKNIILSKELDFCDIEKFASSVNLYAFAYGKDEYMTLRSCPFKEHIGGSCKDCRFEKGLSYTMQNGKKLILERKKLTSCQFVLRSIDVKDLRDKIKISQYIEVL